MTIELTREQEDLVVRVAEEWGKTPAEVVGGLLSQLEWADDAEERALIEERMVEAEADPSSLLTEEEMHARFLQMLKPR